MALAQHHLWTEVGRASAESVSFLKKINILFAEPEVYELDVAIVS